MKSFFRPTSIDDSPALSDFLARAFHVGPDVPFLSPAVLAWKYWEPRGDWEGPRSYVLEKDNVIVAHAGIWPLTFCADAVRGVQMIDWAATRESPGAGLALVQKLAAMFDFMYSIGGSEVTRRVLPALGFIEYAHVWKGVRPLRPVHQLLNHQTRNWKLVPRLARNLLWAMPKSVTPEEGWEWYEQSPSDILRDACQARVADAACSPRPPAFFEYLQACPATPFRFFGIVKRGCPVGHFAISVLRGQARVAGVWMSESSRESLAAVYSLVQQAASRLNGANEVVAMASEGRGSEAAVEAGFRLTRSSPVYLLNKKNRLSLSPSFQFQMADSDAAFLDVGAASYWS